MTMRARLYQSARSRNVLAALGTISGVSYLASREDSREDIHSIEQNLKDTVKPFQWAILHQPKTLNEPLPFPHQNRHVSIQRHATIQKLEQTATKETLQKKYQVNWRKPLGEGAFGAVYSAKDRHTGDTVAVKKISKRFTDNASFQREMDALLRIRESGGHPHICGMRENYDEGGYYYLVLDLVSGGEMFDALVAQGAYSEADAARLIREAASALAFLHGIGIVHGDLKPENLMLSTTNPMDSVIKVVDFGCAQTSASEHKSSPSANTPAYCSPEALEQKKKLKTLDPSFDMWALGVILYIMLTGVHPFDVLGNASDEEIEKNIIQGKMPDLKKSAMTAHLSEDAIYMIKKLLHYDVKKRLTAQDLLEDRWLRGDTARTSKIADSDKRLSAYRAFKTKLGAKVFADMVAWTEEDEDSPDISKRTSLLERAFHSLDPTHRGYITSNELRRLTKDKPSEGADDYQQLSLSGFSDLLAENLRNRYFPKGHIVYREGDKGECMYFINAGQVEVFTKDGFIKNLRKQGDFFGEGALLHPKKIRSASIRCVTPVHAIEVSREYFEKYLASEEGAVLNLREKDKIRKRERAKTMLRLQKNLQQKEFSRGDQIFQIGDEGGRLYIIEEGEVEVSVQDHAVMTLGPGEMLGENALLFGRPRNVSATCVSDSCKLHVLQAKDFYKLLETHPSLKESVRDTAMRREFMKAVCVKTKKEFPKNLKDLRAAFDAADVNHSGKLELMNLRKIIKDFDSNFSEKDIREILKALDLNNSGDITWDEFVKLFGMEKKRSKPRQ